MLVKTRDFGEIEIEEEKILTFHSGIFGFEKDKRYTLLFNKKEEKKTIAWLQSLDTVGVALPVITPDYIMPDYRPVVEDELLTSLGELTEGNTMVLLTLTVPSDITKMTSNLKAPIIVNTETKKGCQVVADNQEYLVKYNVYEIFQAQKKSKGV